MSLPPLSCRTKAVACAAHRLDAVAGPAELAADLHDVLVQGARRAGVVEPPHRFEQVGTRQHLAGTLRKFAQERQLAHRERLARAIRNDEELPRVNPGGTYRENVVRMRFGRRNRGGRAAPERRRDAGEQLAQPQRLRDEIVRAKAEPGDLLNVRLVSAEGTLALGEIIV